MNIRISLIVLLLLALVGCTPAGTVGATQNAPLVFTATPTGPSAVQPSSTAQALQPPAATQQQVAQPSATTQPVATVQQENPTSQPTNTTAPAAPLPANPTATMQAAVPPVPATGQVLQIPADALLDYTVIDSSGNPLGKVKDLVIQRGPNGAGQIPYIIIESSAREDWEIPVPWQVVQFRPDTMSVVVPVSAAQLAAAPGFNKDAWPASFAQSASALHSFWTNPGQPAAGAVLSPGTGIVQAADYIRGKDLMDLKVVNAQGLKLGSIKNLVIDWKNSAPGSASAATFQWSVLEIDDNLNPAEPMVPIPYRLINPAPQQDTLVLNLTPQMLQTVPNFAKDAWPDLYSAPWAAQLAQFWANR